MYNDDIHFSLKLYAAPTLEPLTFDEAVSHLRVDPSTEEESLIEGLIVAARQFVESYCQRRLINSTWDYKLDRFPHFNFGHGNAEIQLPYPPLASVTSVTYIDLDGATQTWSTSSYAVDINSEPGRITLAYLELWPYAQWIQNAVTVRYVAGYGSVETDVPQAIRQAMKLLISHWYENREAVVIGPGMMSAIIPLAVDALLSPYRLIAI